MFNKIYRVKDVAKIVDRDKTTIFRWEREGKVSKPKRDSRGWRIYSKKDVKKLKAVVENTMAY